MSNFVSSVSLNRFMQVIAASAGSVLWVVALLSTKPAVAGADPEIAVAPIPASTILPPPQIPTPAPSSPYYANEDALIQHLSGSVESSGSKRFSTADPKGFPGVDGTQPTSITPQHTPLPTERYSDGVPSTQPGILVTVGNNSDVNVDIHSDAYFTPHRRASLGSQEQTCNRDRCNTVSQSTPPPPNSNDWDFRSPQPTAPANGGSLTPLPPLPSNDPSQASQELRSLPNRGIRDTDSAPQILRSTALNPPTLRLQGVYLYQGDESSARARVYGIYPLTPQVVFGATLDLTNGNAFSDSQEQGLSINELYLATSLRNLPNLRFVVGQLDLTSYFDRNSFAKDGATHFFNSVFQTNPALSTTGIGSRPAALVNWSVTDNLEAKAAIFSSAKSISDFSVDGFAGEVGLRYGNLIIRGTYASDRDAGSKDGFREIYQISRGNGQTGLLKGDHEEAYGVNAETYIPNLKLGLFGRYGHYNNRDLGKDGDTYSAGLQFLDLFSPNDRLGVAYGRNLSNDRLRRQAGDHVPDVLEVFYDFAVLPNLRLGFSLQQLNGFSETIAGVRVKTEFDLTPPRRQVQ